MQETAISGDLTFHGWQDSGLNVSIDGRIVFKLGTTGNRYLPAVSAQPMEDDVLYEVSHLQVIQTNICDSCSFFVL